VGGVSYQPVFADGRDYLSPQARCGWSGTCTVRLARNAKSICPWSCGQGSSTGNWTPRAARQGAFVIAHLPASTAEAFVPGTGGDAAFAQHAGSAARTLSASWGSPPRRLGSRPPSAGNCPAEATTLALSVDGVMAPLKPAEAERAARAASARLQQAG